MISVIDLCLCYLVRGIYFRPPARDPGVTVSGQRCRLIRADVYQKGRACSGDAKVLGIPARLFQASVLAPRIVGSPVGAGFPSHVAHRVLLLTRPGGVVSMTIKITQEKERPGNGFTFIYQRALASVGREIIQPV